MGATTALDRVVALKVLRPALAHGRDRIRFVREARAAAQVRHDHVVEVHAVVNPADGLPYIVMEYLAGPTLAQAIERAGRLGPREAASVALQVAEGLAAAHAAGLVHRDIKPSNVMLDPAKGRTKITDFGLARRAGESSDVTQEGSAVGTPAYMSPEQARGEAVDARSDVYSLGATLYEAMTGEPPFRGTPASVLRQVIETDPRPPRRIITALPREPGDDLPESDGPGPRKTVSDRPRPGRRPGTILAWRDDPGPARRRSGTNLAVRTPPPRDCRAGGVPGGRVAHRLLRGRLAMATS